MTSEKPKGYVTIDQIAEFANDPEFTRVEGNITFPSKYVPVSVMQYGEDVGVLIVDNMHNAPVDDVPFAHPGGIHMGEPDQYYLRCPAGKFAELMQRFEEADQLPPHLISMTKGHEVAMFKAVDPGVIGSDGRIHSYLYEPRDRTARELVESTGK